ncbi:asparaginase [Diaminobutyricimonas aerilata]|uniref:Asparaginase n=1 Tax=Diaminobutyricimonas aerilata TaxID=1162967 RepID=A0A2M9CLC4_9MICO|nr:asparaginase [Diaminobutyricimonas aerilata]PJJ72696.1 asparaginase [Diaminobutyricimonas aerilata]
MTAPLDASGVRELAVLERSGFLESRHLGVAAVVAPDGSLLRAVGDVEALIFPRSSLKPVQAVAVLRAGAVLDDDQLALATASHSGTDRHLAVVASTLASVGLDEGALGTPADRPLDPAARAAHPEPRRIAMTCSGKHAAFLAACVANDWSTHDYLDPAHPLQQRIRDAVAEFTGQPVEHSGVDGCGAPVHAVSTRGLARAIGRIGREGSDDPHASRLAAAVRARPWAVAGPGRPDTVAIERLGVFSKFGAEGIMVMATADGTAVALKMLDGNGRAATMVALELLVQAGAVARDAVDEVIAATTDPVTGGDTVVGRLRPSPELAAEA